MEVWLTQEETDHLNAQYRIDRILHHERSDFQEIVVAESREYGRMLLLDGVIQTTLRDEFIYHEMIAHVPLYTHPNPERVLVIGGGDGGTVREVLRHREVKRVELVEIDGRVVDLSREYLPELARALDDPRVDVRIADGIEHVKTCHDEYDVVLIDSSDPTGPAEGLFTSEFYGNVSRALKDDGLMVAQTGTPFFMPEIVRQTYHAIADQFAFVRLYTASVPTYSMGPFSLTFAAKRNVELKPSRRARGHGKMRYYSPEVHEAAFALPVYLQELLEVS